MTSQRFKSKVTTSGSRAFIPVPFNPSDGTQYLLPLGAAWRRGSGLETGSRVEMVLSPEVPQSESISPDVTPALYSVPEAKAFFESLATFYRNTYTKWIESVRRSETRAARIQEMITLLKAGKKQK